MTVGTSFVCRARRALPWCAAAGVFLAALAACGGGDTASEFSPQRLVVLGDESSLITDGTTAYPATLADGVTPHPKAGQTIPAGQKYSVNGLDAVAPPPMPPASAPPVVDNDPPGPIDCRVDRIWVQRVADEFGFEFEQCNNDPAGTPQRGIIYAEAGARVADLAAQIAQHEASGGFESTDLVTVFIGQHDVLDIYAGVTAAEQCRTVVASPDQSGSAARLARERGAALASQINGIARGGAGGRVLFVTVPDQGATPLGRRQPTDFDRRQCLRSLSDAFNAGLRSAVVQDGRQLGLVAIDEQVQRILEDPDRFDYENASEAACRPDAPLPDCTSATLQDEATENRFLWADDLRFGPDLHELLGDLATSRVRNNPF